MKVSVIIFLAVLALAHCHNDEKGEEPRINGKNGWFIPLPDETFEWMSKEEYRTNLKNFKYSGETIVKFYLNTPSNPDSPQEIDDDPESVKASHFDSSLPTKVTIHGWRGDYQIPLNTDIRDAWLKREPCNIIIVDWSSRSDNLDFLSNVAYIPEVGRILAKYLDFLNLDFGLSYESLTIIGHSFGAQVSAFAAKNVQNGRVNVIVGLDPAFPMYDINDPESRLNSHDAVYVQTIQTNGNQTAFLEPIGRATFYPNGGKFQPGCKGSDAIGMCSHFRSYEYYAEVISGEKSYPAIKCDNYESAVEKNCGSELSSVLMADPAQIEETEGIYYVPVEGGDINEN